MFKPITFTHHLSNINYLLMFLSIFGLLIYYWLVWNKYGRKTKVSVIPQYYPPAGISPSGLCYILGMGYNVKVFLATILTLGMKGYLKIIQTKKFLTPPQFSLVQCGDYHNNTLSVSEKAIVKKLFENSDTVTFEQHKLLLSAAEAHDAVLAVEYGNYFVNNEKFSYIGILISLVLVFGFILFDINVNGKYSFSSLISTIPSIGFAILLIYVPILIVTIKKIGAIIVAMAIVFASMQIVTPIYVVFSVILASINVIFYYLLCRETPAGSQVVAAGKGFKMFLEATQKEQINFRDPPKETVELFEKYLPYALALGFEQRWIKRFAQCLDTTYQPTWYAGNVPFNSLKLLVALTESLSFTDADDSESSSMR